MNHAVNSYFSAKLEVRALPAKGGHGVFARRPMPAGETVMTWGGRVISKRELEQVPEANRCSVVQIEEDLFSITMGPPEPADMINHSCNPNVGLSGQIVLVAMRDIAPGEEVCFDSAMTDSCAYNEFECACGAPNCRGWITGNDWRKPELWERYAGFFSTYSERRIARLRQGQDDSMAYAVAVRETPFAPVKERRLPRRRA